MRDRQTVALTRPHDELSVALVRSLWLYPPPPRHTLSRCHALIWCNVHNKSSNTRTLRHTHVVWSYSHAASASALLCPALLCRLICYNLCEETAAATRRIASRVAPNLRACPLALSLSLSLQLALKYCCGAIFTSLMCVRVCVYVCECLRTLCIFIATAEATATSQIL